MGESNRMPKWRRIIGVRLIRLQPQFQFCFLISLYLSFLIYKMGALVHTGHHVAATMCLIAYNGDVHSYLPSFAHSAALGRKGKIQRKVRQQKRDYS